MMPTVIHTNAPGKIVLLGEYAVLEGAPALVMATDRRAEVEITASDSYHFININSEPESLKFSINNGGSFDYRFQNQQLLDRFDLLTSITQYYLQNRWNSIKHNLLPFSVKLNTQEFYQPQKSGRMMKLGLGSSAALTVCMLLSLSHYLNDQDHLNSINQQFDYLFEAHSNYQQGKGSGVDIASSLYGGVISFQKTEQTTLVERLLLPEKLYMLAIWSGQSADTKHYLQQFYSAKKQAPVVMNHLLEELKAISTKAVEAFKQQALPSLFMAIKAYSQSLKDLAKQIKADIFSQEHIQIESLIGSDACYKPCGAGGGDIGIAFTDEPEKINFLRQRIEKAGYQSVSLPMAPKGVQICKNIKR